MSRRPLDLYATEVVGRLNPLCKDKTEIRKVAENVVADIDPATMGLISAGRFLPELRELTTEALECQVMMILETLE